jgi:nitrogen fixation NifU-like protein
MKVPKFSSPLLVYFYERKGLGRVEQPDGIGSVKSDRIWMEISIQVQNDRIAELKYRCPSCVVAIAACSLLAELVRGKSLEEASEIAPYIVADRLGGIPEERFDRCELAVTALERAISDYHTRRKDQQHESRLYLHYTEQS